MGEFIELYLLHDREYSSYWDTVLIRLSEIREVYKDPIGGKVLIGDDIYICKTPYSMWKTIVFSQQHHPVRNIPISFSSN